MLQARKNLEANDITLRLLKNQKLPQVDLQTRYATTGVGGNDVHHRSGQTASTAARSSASIPAAISTR